MNQVSRLMEEKNELAREVVQLKEELRKCRAWNGYEDWKNFNYTYNDYEDRFYKGGQTTGVVPFSIAYTEMDLRKEYIKSNDL